MDPYQILEIPRTATAAEIKAAYRRLAHKYHPDKPGGDVEKFKEVGAAYEQLKDGPIFSDLGSQTVTGNPFSGYGFATKEDIRDQQDRIAELLRNMGQWNSINWESWNMDRKKTSAEIAKEHAEKLKAEYDRHTAALKEIQDWFNEQIKINS